MDASPHVLVVDDHREIRETLARYLDDHDWDGDRDDDGPGHREPDWFTASVALADGRWLNVAVGPPPGAPAWGPAFVGVFLLSALGIAAVAVVMRRRRETDARSRRQHTPREPRRGGLRATVALPGAGGA